MPFPKKYDYPPGLSSSQKRAFRAKLNPTSPVEITCDSCGNKYRLTYHYYRTRGRLRDTNYCKECMRNYKSKKSSEYWNTRTTDEIKAHGNHSSDMWKNKSRDTRELELSRLHRSRDAFWNNITDDKFVKWKLNYVHGRSGCNGDRWNNELDFLTLLRKHNLHFVQQFYSRDEHPEFKKLFPVNPATGSRNIVPFHQWDFLVYSPTGDVLIDIDGSVHSIQPGRYIVKKHGIDKFDVGLNQQFNDSQRQYQTDGLDAYVVQCYDDKLTLSTPVINLKYPNDKMNVKLLLSILTVKKKKKGN